MTVVCLISSCESDGELSSITGGLEGEWETIALEIDITSESTTALGDLTQISNMVGQNFNYTLSLNDGKFTTNGGYEMSVTTMADGLSIGPVVAIISNVSEEGTYTVSGNKITMDGELVEVDSNAPNAIIPQQQNQVAAYSVDGDFLTLSQDVTVNDNQGGVSASHRVRTESTLRRK